MATTPQRPAAPPRPAPPAAPTPPDQPASPPLPPVQEPASAHPQPKADEPKAPLPPPLDPPVKTIADEQRERSAEMEAEGIENWKAKLDGRDPSERQHAVAGVAPVEGESWEGSSRSTPEARAAQHGAAP